MTDAVEAVLFDLDDTLCSYRRDAATVLEHAFDRADVPLAFEAGDYYARYGEYLEASTDVSDLRARCFGDLASEAGHGSAAGHRVAEAFAEIRDQRAVDPLPGAIETVENLRGEGVPIGLVTNGDPGMQRHKLEAIGLPDAFDTVVFAGYDTPPKPAADPFEAALDDLGSRPSRAVHVGNSLASDVAGAHAAGVGSVWVPAEGVVSDPDPEPEYVLESLAEFGTLPWS